MRLSLLILPLLLTSSVFADPATTHPAYATQAAEVMSHVQKTFWDDARHVYTKSPTDRAPDYVWRQAEALSAVVACAKHDPTSYRPLLDQFIRGLDAYWDAKAPVPGYEPAPTKGNGHDKYYDDNAWLIIALAEAYELTHDKSYLDRAEATARFVASGYDDEAGGGIWWHASHKDGSKNACANGPAAFGFLRLALLLDDNQQTTKYVDLARKTVEWTEAKLQDRDGLYDDRLIVATGEVKRGKLTYNSALMIRAQLELYRQTGDAKWLEKAKRIAAAADWFADKSTGVYRDPLKWSHFMVEADLDVYRTTGDAHALQRARTNVDAFYAAWKANPPTDMMSNVNIVRLLWLMSDVK